MSSSSSPADDGGGPVTSGEVDRALLAAPSLLAHLPEIEACHSVAGVESYLLEARTSSPDALEALLRTIRQTADVTTRTTVVLSTLYEDRPPL